MFQIILAEYASSFKLTSERFYLLKISFYVPYFFLQYSKEKYFVLLKLRANLLRDLEENFNMQLLRGTHFQLQNQLLLV